MQKQFIPNVARGAVSTPICTCSNKHGNAMCVLYTKFGTFDDIATKTFAKLKMIHMPVGDVIVNSQ